ncbi:MAG TPA: tRNA (adenosine(37)-N6)-dimethylallyltransferase MiaA [Rhizomicrobium sp.]|jgi:tRNA dimethylallyltransferase|nr:tRNA (adenosine(37)-N6)-dimethylallyltransferase MiaA [Rhizomicrobium sp.]
MKKISADVVLIAGPTASGKSAAALALAEQIGGTIVNADSMQVYAEPRILTARPPDEDVRRVPHLLYGHVSVREPYSVGLYQSDAARALTEVRAMKRVPIFVGGTGMYFGVLTQGLANIPAVPASIRAEAEARRKQIGAEAFHAELVERDPESAARLRASDAQRVLRAYEVFEATGRPLSYWQKEMEKPVLAGLNLARFVIAPPRAELYARIDARFDGMVVCGALKEAAALSNLDLSLPAAKILGLRELLAVRVGAMSLDEAKSAAKQATRQYAKRQLTWFRNRMADWCWIETSEASKGAAAAWASMAYMQDCS